MAAVSNIPMSPLPVVAPVVADAPMAPLSVVERTLPPSRTARPISTPTAAMRTPSATARQQPAAPAQLARHAPEPVAPPIVLAKPLLAPGAAFEALLEPLIEPLVEPPLEVDAPLPVGYLHEAPALADVVRVSPGPESIATKVRIRLVTVLAMVSAFAYLWWRVAFTMPGGVLPWLVLLFEAMPVAALLRRASSLWSIDPRNVPGPDDRFDGSVAILLPTYNEPAEILLPTIAAALEVRGASEVWVLDDGRRPEVKHLAEELGARYMMRSHNRHAKAGNLNHALGLDASACTDACRDDPSAHILADAVLVLDCDHVPMPQILEKTGPYLADPGVALVQVPQAFYNIPSFEHHLGTQHGDEGLPGEQDMFFHVIQRAKDRSGSTFWCGSGGLVRTSALAGVGGVATDTITEDMHTTIKLVGAGWRVRYHAEVLAVGLAPQTAMQYVVQRRRWALGSFQILVREKLWRNPGLNWRQRVSYLNSILWWLEGLVTLSYFAIPTALVLASRPLVDAPFPVWAIAAAVVTGVRLVANAQLSRNRARPLASVVLQLVRTPASLSAAWWLVTRREEKFVVTPKGRMADAQRTGARVPRVLWGLTAIVYGTFFVVLLRSCGLLGAPQGLGALAVSAVWLGLLGALLAAACSRFWAETYGAERRASYRLAIDVPVDLAVSVQEQLLTRRGARTADVSLTGVRVRTSHDAVGLGADVTMTVGLRDAPLELQGVVVRMAVDDVGPWIGVELAGWQLAARARLALACFHGKGVPNASGALATAAAAGHEIDKSIAAPVVARMTALPRRGVRAFKARRLA
jgi:cellulose synthase (UDP-forming)